MKKKNKKKVDGGEAKRFEKNSPRRATGNPRFAKGGNQPRSDE